MKIQLLLLFITSAFIANSQVAIGTTNIQNGAALQIESDSKGVLIPRVSLMAKNLEAPITPSPIATGLMVYNIATSGSDSNAVVPGFYYWSGSLWVSLEETTGSGDSWSLSGNTGTTPGTNYLGTSNNVDLQFKTNAVRRATIKNDGALILGNNNTPLSNTLTSVYPSGSQIGIYASSQNSPRTIRALNFSGTEFVIDGGNFDANGGRGVIGISANMAANSTVTVTGVLGLAGRTSFTELQGESVGVSAQGTTALHARGVGKSTEDYYAGYFEYDQDDNIGTSTGPFARIAGKDYDYFTGGASRRDVTYGGYFDANTNSNDYVFVGARNNNTSYKVLGGGSVSTMVKDKEGNNRILHTTETPEILFEDFGIGELVNGEVYIEIDEVLSKNIYVNKNHPMKVFIQLEGDCNGVYVTNKTKKGFLVKELGKGKSNVSFSWNLVANRADALNADGSLSSKHVGVRLPIGPAKLEPNKQTIKSYDNTEYYKD
ncbi:hypothetical protein N7U66_06265 [Lacinutrix neustonica]|uniref:T9SS C-terminal target domain-containing protein n=1 Tax=Lacinutrix neustonica TaxID=2980107 RepID=A0A9E8MYF1_9FLAO|nr:hypothetical protein [Lacinutrix neustonica]WAC03190.1 hypothetical protein N7U66_06265 [Lacinutrix neustonica]